MRHEGGKMELLRLGGVLASKFSPLTAFALFVVLTLVGFAQPAHAYPAECTGNASDGTPRCVKPNISAQGYGMCIQTGVLWPDDKLNNCAGSATGGRGIVGEGTGNAVLTCLIEEPRTFSWKSDGAQIVDNLFYQ